MTRHQTLIERRGFKCQIDIFIVQLKECVTSVDVTQIEHYGVAVGGGRNLADRAAPEDHPEDQNRDNESRTEDGVDGVRMHSGGIEGTAVRIVRPHVHEGCRYSSGVDPGEASQ